MQVQQVDIAWSTLWKVLLMVIFAVGLFFVREVLMMVFLALVLSSAIYHPVKFFEKHSIPRPLSVLVIFVLAGAILALVLYAMVPIALIQLQFLLENISTIKDPLFELAGGSDLLTQIDNGITGVFETLFEGGSAIFSFLSKFLGNIFFVLVSLVLAFYMAISRDGVERFLRGILPTKSEAYGITLFQRTRRQLGRWLGGQLVLSIVVGILTFIGFSLVGIEYALALALLAAVLELVPYVGPIAVGIVAFLVTLPQSLALAIMVVIVTFIIQQLENNVLVPIIMSKAIGTDPVIVVIALLAGAKIAGLLGMILAVPAVIVLQEIIDDWSEQKHKRVGKKAA